MTIATGIEIEPVTPAIGAVVRGVDLSKDLSDEEFGALHDALMEHLVLFFHDQDLMDPARFKAFGQRWGELETGHVAAEGSAEHPEVLRMHFDANSKHIAGSSWHTDVTAEECPPMGTILYNHTVPPAGGDTLFASMYAAYDALSDRMKTYLEGLTALHDAEHVFRPITPDLSKRFPQAVHPLVRTHPVTGRKSLFCDPMYTVKINEVSKSESQGILNFLWKHCEDVHFQCRFRWRPNSVAMWDNRCTQHMALWDYFPQTRSGFRIGIMGDRPR